jgi:hypothetical protein
VGSASVARWTARTRCERHERYGVPIMRNDGIVAPMSPHQIARFIGWLESQAARHYEQRLQLKLEGRYDVAYGLKLEAHTYERVLHASWQVIGGESPGQVPTRL